VGLLPGPAAAQDQRPWYERLRFAGDFRLRSESFFRDDAPDRTRLRIQLHAGFALSLDEHFSFGLRLASGIPGNVTSANVDLGDAFTQKTFRLDRAYLTWTPHPRVEITGGKFGLSVWRPGGQLGSQLVFDEDLAPEGFHESVTVLTASEGLLRRLDVLGQQWSLREVGSGSDTWMVGGQVVAELSLPSRFGLDLAAGYYDYLSGRALAQARNGNDQLLVTNSVVTRGGTILQGGRSLSPSATDPFDRFVSAFRLLQVLVGLRPPALGGREVAVLAEWVHNFGASGDNGGLFVGGSWGGSRNPGDWGVGASWSRVLEEAVPSLFSYSDFGLGGTNLQGFIVQVSWRPARSLALQVKDHIVSPVQEVAGGQSGTLHRLQLDARISF
jgi:hypothetical protein